MNENKWDSMGVSILASKKGRRIRRLRNRPAKVGKISENIADFNNNNPAMGNNRSVFPHSS